MTDTYTGFKRGAGTWIDTQMFLTSRVLKEEDIPELIEKMVRPTLAYIDSIGKYVKKYDETGEATVIDKLGPGVVRIQKGESIKDLTLVTFMSRYLKILYSRIVFSFKPVLKYEFNMFNGLDSRLLPYSQLETNDSKLKIGLFRNLLKRMVGDADPMGAEYLPFWVAQNILHPEDRTRTSVIISSVEQGTGKNTFGLVLKNLVGPRYTLCVPSLNHLTGQFNSHMAGRLLVIMTELRADDYHADFDLFKTYITEDEQLINTKNIPAYQLDCYASYIGFSNHLNNIKIEKTDRRLAIYRSKEERMTREERLEISEHLLSPEGRDVIYTWLHTLKLPYREPPQSEVKDQIIEGCRDELDEFVDTIPEEIEKYNGRHLDQGKIVPVKTKQKGVWVAQADVYKVYQEWVELSSFRSKNPKYNLSYIKFNKRLPMDRRKKITPVGEKKTLNVFLISPE